MSHDRPALHRCRPPCAGAWPGRRGQRGQSLVLGLIVLFGSLLGMMFLFSTGQVLDARQRLDNAADAAAYSAALWRARVFNFQAYSNRAVIAQEVAVAQAVTLTAWARYFDTFLESAEQISRIYPPVAAVVQAASELAHRARLLAESTAADEIGWRADPVIGYKRLLLRSQALLHRSADTFGMGAVANEVARANDRRFFAFALTDHGSFERFSRVHDSDHDRHRFASAVRASLDPFTGGARDDDLALPLPSSCLGRSGDPRQWSQWYRKRGGTALTADLERWEAIDTASIHNWRSRRFFGCSDRETIPFGWGMGQAGERGASATNAGAGGGAGLPAAMGLADAWFGGSRYPNPAATRRAQADAADDDAGFTRYDGIARIRDLAYEALGDARYPVSRVSVLARIEAQSVRTANVLNVGTGRLRLFERFAGGRIWSLASAEVHFRPPPGESGRIEYASFYSPYWQARLVEPSDIERTAARAHVR